MLLSMIVTMTSCAPVRALSTPAMPAHSAPPSAAPMTQSSRCSAEGQVEREPDEPGEDATEDDLALGTDVEQPGAEPDAQAETGEDQGRRDGERLGQRADRRGRTSRPAGRRSPRRRAPRRPRRPRSTPRRSGRRAARRSSCAAACTSASAAAMSRPAEDQGQHDREHRHEPAARQHLVQDRGDRRRAPRSSARRRRSARAAAPAASGSGAGVWLLTAPPGGTSCRRSVRRVVGLEVGLAERRVVLGGLPHGVLQRDAGHHQAQHVAVGAAGHVADDPAAVHDQDAVGEREHLVQLGRHDDHRGAVVALLRRSASARTRSSRRRGRGSAARR